MLLKVYILFIVLFSFNAELVHDFHLSKTDIHYKSEKQALQLTVHTFIDDTEEVLRTKEDLEYKFFESNEHSATDSIFATYLQEQLVIKIDGEQKDFLYLGKEQSDDILGVYSYLEIEGLTAFDEIEVHNAILTDLYDDQKNIINVKVDNKSRAFHILTKKDYKKQIQL